MTPYGWNITETAKSGPIEADVLEVECQYCGREMRWSDGDKWWSCRCGRKYNSDLYQIEDGEE